MQLKTVTTFLALTLTLTSPILGSPIPISSPQVPSPISDPDLLLELIEGLSSSKLGKLAKADPSDNLGKIIKGVSPSQLGKALHDLSHSDLEKIVKNIPNTIETLANNKDARDVIPDPIGYVPEQGDEVGTPLDNHLETFRNGFGSALQPQISNICTQITSPMLTPVEPPALLLSRARKHEHPGGKYGQGDSPYEHNTSVPNNADLLPAAVNNAGQTAGNVGGNLDKVNGVVA